MKEQSRDISPAELEFWTSVKSYFTTLEEDETPCSKDKAILLLLGLFVLVPMVLGLVVRVLNM